MLLSSWTGRWPSVVARSQRLVQQVESGLAVLKASRKAGIYTKPAISETRWRDVLGVIWLETSDLTIDNHTEDQTVDKIIEENAWILGTVKKQGGKRKGFRCSKTHSNKDDLNKFVRDLKCKDQLNYGQFRLRGKFVGISQDGIFEICGSTGCTIKKVVYTSAEEVVVLSANPPLSSNFLLKDRGENTQAVRIAPTHPKTKRFRAY